MKLLFLILAHNQPSQTYDLARTITEAASDGRAIIHFDASANVSDFELLANSITGAPKIELVKNRVACKWGDFSLVEAVINALKQERASGSDYDYVVLLSGSCLPCRPIKQLERYLTENYGREFIEAQGEDWILDGLRRERHEFYFPISPSYHDRKWYSYGVALQRQLGVRRTPPGNLQIRFGSQWWGLTWKTCTAILDDLLHQPATEKFFRTTYIPDEMLFPTLVWKLAGRKNIAQFGLTHFQFTDQGKPVVYFDDHGLYPLSFDRFFYRKVSDEAHQLRKRSISRAFEQDDGSSLSEIGKPNFDYKLLVEANTAFPSLGQAFCNPQLANWDQSDPREARSVLGTADGKYVFVCGTPETIQNALARVDPGRFDVLGRIFAPDEVDLGPSRTEFHGLERSEIHIRNLHPLLYLARLRQRATKIPVFGWAVGDLEAPMSAVVRDPKALVVMMPVIGPEEDIDWRKLAHIATQSLELGKDIPGVRISNLKKVAARATAVPFASAWNGDFRHNLLSVPVVDSNGPNAAKADAMYRQSRQLNQFRHEQWFDPIADAIAGSATPPS